MNHTTDLSPTEQELSQAHPEIYQEAIKQGFWAYQNGYDTTSIHSSKANPELEKLTVEGEQKANRYGWMRGMMKAEEAKAGSN